MAKFDTSLKRLREQQENNRRRKDGSRRKFLVGTVTLAASLPLLAGYLYRDKIVSNVRVKILDKPSFLDAQKLPETRQKFLDNLLFRECIPYCDGVVYDSDGSKITKFYGEELKAVEASPKYIMQVVGQDLKELSQGNYDLKTPNVFNAMGKLRHAKIFVGRKTFNENGLFKDEQELKQAIVAHEGRHVDQYSNGFGYLFNEEIVKGLSSKEISPHVLYTICEYDATAHELHSTLKGDFNVSSGYIENRKREFIKEGFKLTSFSRSSSQIQRKIIEDTHKAIYDKFPELREIIY